MVASLIERCMAPVKQALDDAKLATNAIDEVILIGGSTRIPAIQALVKKLTGGKAPNMTVNPDEVVALGAAVQAGILKGDVSDVLLLDVTPLSLGVETMGGVMTTLIERNTTIPARRTETFSTADDNQTAVDVVVLQGEREMAQDNRTLGRFRLEGIRQASRGVPQIEVTFDIDANGILNVSAQDKDTAKEQHITISGSTSLEQGEIDRMIRDAETHAAEDQSRRESADVRNHVDSLAYQVERTLSEMGTDAPLHEKARAEQMVADARAALHDNVEINRLRTLASDLEQIVHSLGAAQPVGATAGSGSDVPDDVVDVEYTEKP